LLTHRTALHVRWTIGILLLVNAASMLTPVINEGDSVVYAALSQHIMASGDWADLVLSGTDWLDKPHFPFWLTALSFKLGGVRAWTYIFPGYLFHLVGATYTYRIARLRFDRDTALMSLLVYVSVYHLMYTSSAVKAEAFLTGSITAACYYWLRYDAQSRAKYLLLGALFTALSVMTKGIFTVITIASGLVCMWIFQRQWSRLWCLKWWCALALSMAFTLPELVALYLQFDAHPEKLVFGATGVSGIRFFLWDSQFGRFFNSGPITNQSGNPAYFFHVLLWAFLPWVLVLGTAMVSALRTFGASTHQDRSSLVFLGGAFFVTFALFSATSFQLDYYTVILYPFAAIVCGHYLSQSCASGRVASRVLVWGQRGVVLVVAAFAVALSLYVGRTSLLILVLSLVVAGLAYATISRDLSDLRTVLVLPALSIAILYAFLELMTFLAVTQHSVPYNVTRILQGQQVRPIYFYKMDYIVPLEMALYQPGKTRGISSPAELLASAGEQVLVVREEQLAELQGSVRVLQQLGQGSWVDHKSGILPRMLKLAKGTEPLDKMLVVLFTTNRQVPAP
jgi:4-amino-4-deoxy-L-arabinose transferase-like glycosyltransferase